MDDKWEYREMKMRNGSTLRFRITGRPVRLQGADNPMLYCWICDAAFSESIWNEHVRVVHEENEDG